MAVTGIGYFFLPDR